MNAPLPATATATALMSGGGDCEPLGRLKPAVWLDGRRVESVAALPNKLEAVRLLCQETGCAQRQLAHDALSALAPVTARLDDATLVDRGHRPRLVVREYQRA